MGNKMQKEIWQPKRIIEEQYRRSLMDLMRHFQEILASMVITDPAQIVEALQTFTDVESFYEFGKAAASRMVTGLYFDSARTWREAARVSMRGREIHSLLQKELHGPMGLAVQHIVDRNAKLISTFPETISNQVAHFIERESLAGRRAEFITRDLLNKFPDVASSRIALIARTETSKASTALTRARAENLGLAWFVWRTSKDARVRDSHRMMDRVLVGWNDLPSPEALAGEKSYGKYGPGEIFNCRCFPQPLIDISDVKWPCRVYSKGQIQYLTRIRFEGISNWRLREAA